MMRKRLLKRSRAICEIEFDRGKYGRELLVDAAMVSDLSRFISDRTPHRLWFHDILLITSGRGALVLDGQLIDVTPGTVIVTLPGQVREWHLEDDLDGRCLFFVEDFLARTFCDPYFIDQFSFLRETRAAPSFRLQTSEQRTFGRYVASMQRELALFLPDSTHALRASLYATLVALDRWFVAQHGAAAAAYGGRAIERFRTSIEKHFTEQRSVAFYAARLGISPGHLNVMCKQELGCNAGDLIRARVMLEARRLLRHNGLRTGEVAARLGFGDAAYFARFCRRESGLAPRELRFAGNP